MLKASISKETFNGLPDVLKAEYKVDEGNENQYLLETDDKALRDQVREFRQNNVALLKQEKELSEKLKNFADLDPVEAHKAIETMKALEERKLIDSGEIDKVVENRTAEMKRAHKTQLDQAIVQKETEAQSRAAAEAKLGKILIDNEVQTAVTGIGTIRKGAMPDVLARARSVYQIENGEPTPKDANGDTIYSAEDATKPMPISEWATKLATDAAHLFEGSSGGGSKGGDNHQNSGGKVIDASDKEAFGANLEDIARGKVQVRMS